MDRVKKLGEDYPSVPVRSWLRRETYRIFAAQAAREGTSVDGLLSRMADKAAGVIVQVHPDAVVPVEVEEIPVVEVVASGPRERGKDKVKRRPRRPNLTAAETAEIQRLVREEDVSDRGIVARLGYEIEVVRRHRRAGGLQPGTKP